MVMQIRSVTYTENGELTGTGHETVKEVELCKICSEIADGRVPKVIGHKVINKVLNKHGVHTDTEINMCETQ